jgi:hypothetical protein
MTYFVVTSANDSGPDTFRQALLDLESSTGPGPYEIDFDSTLNITLLTQLPTITKPLTINGFNSSIIRTSLINMLTIDLPSIDDILINDFIFDNDLSNTVDSSVYCSSINNCNLTLSNVRYRNINVQISSDIATYYGYCINITNGTLNMNNDVSFTNIYFNKTSTALEDYSMIYALNTTISIDSAYFGDNRCSFTNANNIYGMIINTNSSITANNLSILDNYLSFGTTLFAVNVGLICVKELNNITLTNSSISRNGVDITNVNHKFSNGFIYTTTNGGTLLVEDCTFDGSVNALIFNTNYNTTMRSVSTGLSFTNMTNSTLYSNSALIDNFTMGNNGNPITISNINGSSITNNALDTAGFKINATSTIITNCNFSDCDFNNSNQANNGLQITGNTNLTISNCSFYNMTGRGPPLIITGTSSRTINYYLTDCTFNLCTASIGIGGAISIDNRSNIVHSNLNIQNCTSSNGGALSLSACNVQLQSSGIISRIIDCTALNNGGAIYYNRAYANTTDTLDGFEILNCTANTRGGGIYMYGGSIPIFTNLTIINCYAEFGGGIYISGFGTFNVNPDLNVNINKNNATEGRNYNISSATIVFDSMTINLEDPDSVVVVRPKNTDIGTLITSNTTVTFTDCVLNVSNAGYTYGSTYAQSTDALTIMNTLVNMNDTTVFQANTFNSSFSMLTGISEDKTNKTGIVSTTSTNINCTTIKNYGTGLYSQGSSMPTNNISNSTLSNNNIAINTLTTSALSVTNCTILDNEIGISTNSNIANTLIARNVQNVANVNNIVSIANNATDIDDYSIFTQPTDIVSINVVDNIGPLQNNGGISDTYALLNYNVCLNKGDNSFVVGSYDNRGEGFNRIVDSIVDIGAFENQNPIVCFTKDCMILIERHGLVRYEKVTNVHKGDKVVVAIVDKNGNNSTTTSTIVHNVVTGKREWFVRIDKNGIDKNSPFCTTHFTGGHMLYIPKDNVGEIKARDIVGNSKYGSKVTKVKLEKQDVYSIVLQDRSYINVNGILNVAFGKDEWDNLVQKKNIIWRENE